MIAEIIPGIHLCSTAEANSTYFINTLRPKYILSVDSIPDEVLDKNIVYCHISMQDQYDNSVEPFTMAINAINTSKKMGLLPMMVHCAAGVSRSPSVLALYMWNYQDPQQFNTIDDAFKYIQKTYESPLGKNSMDTSPVLRFIKHAVIPTLTQ